MGSKSVGWALVPTSKRGGVSRGGHKCPPYAGMGAPVAMGRLAPRRSNRWVGWALVPIGNAAGCPPYNQAVPVGRVVAQLRARGQANAFA